MRTEVLSTVEFYADPAIRARLLGSVAERVCAGRLSR
jgi:hypothetical protein